MEVSGNDLNISQNEEPIAIKSEPDEASSPHTSQKTDENKMLGKRSCESDDNGHCDEKRQKGGSSDEIESKKNDMCEVKNKVKNMLVPQLTLYLPSKTVEHDLASPVMTIFESCIRSNVSFTFSHSQNTHQGRHLLIQGKIISTGYGKKTYKARADAGKKALKILQGRQPIVYKPESENPLGKDEVIPGLTLYLEDCAQGKNRNIEVIKESCEKCNLHVDWWDDSGQNLFGVTWAVLLLINSKLICKGRGATREEALEHCAITALRDLKRKHPVTYKSELSVEQPTFSNVPGLTLYVSYRGEENDIDPITIITKSCEKSKMFCTFEGKGFKLYENHYGTGEKVHHVTLSINGTPVVAGCGMSKKHASANAGKRALDALLKTQPVIYENDGTTAE